MDNVIQFPKGKLGSPPQSIEEVIEAVENSRREHIEMFMSLMIPFVFQKACDEGFDITQDQCIKTNTFFVESLNAVLCKAAGMHHPIHDVVDEIADGLLDDDDDEEKAEEIPENLI
jgi:hypothetical protein